MQKQEILNEFKDTSLNLMAKNRRNKKPEIRNG